MFAENLVEFVDILPTLVEASGLPELEKCPIDSRDIPICREGTSLLRISEGDMKFVRHTMQWQCKKLNISGNDWKEAVFYQQPRNYRMSNSSEFYQGEQTINMPLF